MEEKLSRYLDSVCRNWVSGSWGTDRSNSLLARKRSALGIKDGEYEQAEKDLIARFEEVLGFLNDLSPSGVLGEEDLEEFREFCDDIGVDEGHQDSLVQAYQNRTQEGQEQHSSFEQSDIPGSGENEFPREVPDLVGGGMTSIHTPEELHPFLKGFVPFLAGEVKAHQIICHPILEAVFLPYGIGVIPDEDIVSFKVKHLLLYSPDRQNWFATPDDMIHRVEAGDRYFITDLAMHVCLEVEYFMLNDLVTLLEQDVQGIGMLPGFRWKEGELGKIKRISFEEFFQGSNGASEKKDSEQSAGDYTPQEEADENIETGPPGPVKEYPLPETPYVLSVSEGFVNDFPFFDFHPLAVRAVKDFQKSLAKASSVRDLSEGNLIKLISRCTKEPVKFSVQKAIDNGNFDIGESHFLIFAQHAMDIAAEIGKACQAGSNEIKLLMAENRYEKSTSQRSSTMFMGNVGVMLGLAAISGAGKVLSSAGNALSNNRFESELDRQLFEKLSPSFDALESELQKALVAMYDSLAKIVGGRTFFVLFDVLNKTETILDNIEKIKETKPEIYRTELVKIIQNIPRHHGAIKKLFDELEPGSDAQLALLDFAEEWNPGQVNEYRVLRSSIYQQRGDLEQATVILEQTKGNGSTKVSRDAVSIEDPIWLEVKESLAEEEDALAMWKLYLSLRSSVQKGDLSKAAQIVPELAPFAITDDSELFLPVFSLGIYSLQGEENEVRRLLHRLWLEKWGENFSNIETVADTIDDSWGLSCQPLLGQQIRDFREKLGILLHPQDVALLKKECASLKDIGMQERIFSLFLKILDEEKEERWENIVSFAEEFCEIKTQGLKDALTLCILNARIQAAGGQLDEEDRTFLREMIWPFFSYAQIQEVWPRADFPQCYKEVDDQIWSEFSAKAKSRAGEISQVITQGKFSAKFLERHNLSERFSPVLKKVNKSLKDASIPEIIPESVLAFYDAPKSHGVITYEGIYAVGDGKLFAYGYGGINYAKESGLMNTYLKLYFANKETLEIPLSGGSYAPVEVLAEMVSELCDSWLPIMNSDSEVDGGLIHHAINDPARWRQVLGAHSVPVESWAEIGVFEEKERLSISLEGKDSGDQQEIVANMWEEKLKAFCKQINALNDSKSFSAPAIPDKKLETLVRELKKAGVTGIDEDSVIFLYDDTVWGKSDKGILITRAGLATNQGGTPLWIPWSALSFAPTGKSGINYEIAINFKGGTGCTLQISGKKVGLAVQAFLQFVSEFQKQIGSMDLLSESCGEAIDEGSEIEKPSDGIEDDKAPENSSGFSISAQILGDLASELGYAAKENHVLLGPSITEKKRANAATQCKIQDENDILALIDTTVFKSAKNALCFTADGLYWHNDWSVSKGKGANFVSYKDFGDCSFSVKGSEIFTIGFPIGTSGSTMSTKDISKYLCALRGIISAN